MTWLVYSLPRSGRTGIELDVIRRLVSHDPEALDLLDRACERPTGVHAGVDNVNATTARPDGTSAAYALRKLRRDAPEIAAEKAEQQEKAWDLWLDCNEQKSIAEEMGVSEATIVGWFKERKSAEIEPPASRQHFDVWTLPPATTPTRTDGVRPGTLRHLAEPGRPWRPSARNRGFPRRSSARGRDDGAEWCGFGLPTRENGLEIRRTPSL